MRSLVGGEQGEKVGELYIMTNSVCYIKVLKLLPHVICEMFTYKNAIKV